VSQKRQTIFFVHNFAKYRLISKILSSLYSAKYLQKITAIFFAESKGERILKIAQHNIWQS